jgi:hypothetical protein
MQDGLAKHAMKKFALIIALIMEHALMENAYATPALKENIAKEYLVKMIVMVKEDVLKELAFAIKGGEMQIVLKDM